MGKKTQQYPTYKRGDLLRLKKDKKRYEVFHGETHESVYVPAGEVCSVSHHITPGLVIVTFQGDYSHCSGLALNVLTELEAV